MNHVLDSVLLIRKNAKEIAKSHPTFAIFNRKLELL